MENPVSALTPDARKKREKKSDGTWQKRVVKDTKKVMRQQEIDSLFASVEQAMTAPTETKESIAKQIAPVKPKGTVKLTAALFKKQAAVRVTTHSITAIAITDRRWLRNARNER